MNYKNKKVSFRVLGCRLNQSEVASLKNQFAHRGYRVVGSDDVADITIINSCAVTTQAEAKTRAEITAAAKVSPKGKIILTGCYAQEKKADLLNLKNVHMVIGNLEKTRLVEFVENMDQWANKAEVADVNDPRLVQSHDYYTFSQDSIAETDRTRAFVKIQDGCNYFCTYCIIPFLRGRVRSRKSDEILQEVMALEQKGYKEIVLSGINIGTYKQDEDFDLTALLRSLLENTSTTRFRLSSIEPNLITGEMIMLMKVSTRLCNYFHIPLQHGSDKILKLMNRKYNLDDFAEVITKIRRAIPNIAIGTDAIVGFPGEDEEDFQGMYDFIQKYEFPFLHIFRYSKRDGTKAAKMPHQVRDIDKKNRSAKLRKLGDQLQENYIKKFLNKELDVLFESPSGGNSDNFVYVKVNSDKDLTNEMKKVKITKVFKSQAEGVIIE
ncbi:MAG: tRNA (N(6)-L-threonylcarbamoyladenosine(37)-C(2))-methylthiotransferase MtaB [Candidatus Marinimicrobia bacterium]|nr:tRNA (N(6)-L-threonylcarbamoyladenosine(37)-C(2))-methylthiotransferase MtaB [Candidatus Neomarinimicrobiota bacterium]